MCISNSAQTRNQILVIVPPNAWVSSPTLLGRAPLWTLPAELSLMSLSASSPHPTRQKSCGLVLKIDLESNCLVPPPPALGSSQQPLTWSCPALSAWRAVFSTPLQPEATLLCKPPWQQSPQWAPDPPGRSFPPPPAAPALHSAPTTPASWTLLPPGPLTCLGMFCVLVSSPAHCFAFYSKVTFSGPVVATLFKTPTSSDPLSPSFSTFFLFTPSTGMGAPKMKASESCSML